MGVYAGADLNGLLHSMIPRLLVRFALCVLPAILLAALTRNLSQFFVGVIAVALFFYATEMIFARARAARAEPPSGAAWISWWTLVFIGLAIGLALTWWLYRSRRSRLGIVGVFAIVAIFFLGAPWLSPATEWRLHRRWQADAKLDKQFVLSFDEAKLLLPAETDRPVTQGDDEAQRKLRRPVRLSGFGLPLPLVVRGVSGDTFMVPISAEFTMRTATGTVQRGMASLFIPVEGRYYPQRPTQAIVPYLSALPLRAADLPDDVSLEVRVHGEVFRRHLHTTKTKLGWNRLESVGNCWFAEEFRSFCLSFGPRFPLAEIEGVSLGSVEDASALLAFLPWDPLESRDLNIRALPPEIHYETWDYVAPVETQIVIPDYRLGNYSFSNSELRFKPL